MATIAGFAATEYAQILQGVLDDTSFDVGSTAPAAPAVPPGKKPFTALSNADVIMYRAYSLEDPSIWEVGKVAYDSTDEQLDRLDASVIASSNSNNTVDFRRSDGSGMNVMVEGISGVAYNAAYTITNYVADRALDANLASSSHTITDATVAAVANAAISESDTYTDAAVNAGIDVVGALLEGAVNVAIAANNTNTEVALDALGADILELADVVATLVNDLNEAGIITASVS